MGTVRNGSLAGPPARPARTGAKSRRRRAWSSMAVSAALAGMGLATVFAAPAWAPPLPITPPAHGVVPGVAVVAIGSPEVNLFYTATDGTVWYKEGVGSSGPPIPLYGHLVSAPAPIGTGITDFTGTIEAVFGRGTDNQLWYAENTNDAWTGWMPLGGQLTSKPGVAALGGGALRVFVRGTDGAVWQRAYSGTAWSSWQRVGGHVLAGTGPTAAYLTGTGHLYVGVAGIDGQMYLKTVNLTDVNVPAGFFSIGGHTTTSPALTAISPSVLVAFARGTDGAGYHRTYTEAGGPAGWQSMGGRLTSGLAASSTTVAGKTTTYTMALGTDNQVYENDGTWASGPPGFSGWSKVSGWTL